MKEGLNTGLRNVLMKIFKAYHLTREIERNCKMDSNVN